MCEVTVQPEMGTFGGVTNALAAIPVNCGLESDSSVSHEERDEERDSLEQNLNGRSTSGNRNR